MPYARTRRVDVAHPYRGVATHNVDLDDIVQRAHALSLLLSEGAAISHGSAALVRGLPLPRALRLDPMLHVFVNLVNTFFREKLMELPSIRTYIEGIQAGHAIA
ncbi:MAG: hypothetical protein Q7T15_09250 [Microcella sp.]|uniref:hypothetical protein n=1 Tax=Microcella sp. TaxID=1913979 RepID=UPI00271C06B3|nr:hypothetical protein [Microcella sp.]MDO8338424.1 hypothetical protein [Microcella sp.]